MVSRRGGGSGDTAGGDAGLPSGVSPAAAEAMNQRPARSYLAHNDRVSRTWWVEEFPRSRHGVPAGLKGLPGPLGLRDLGRPDIENALLEGDLVRGMEPTELLSSE